MNENKKNIINLFMFIIGITIVSITFNTLCVPKNIVIGGVSGIAVIFNYLFKIDVTTTLLIGNILLIVMGVLVLGFKDTIPSIIGSFIYTLGVYLTENLITIEIDSIFLNIVAVGVLYGIGCTLIYLAGYSTGGTDILGIIFQKRLGYPLGRALLIINILILIFGTVVFGPEMLIIGLVIRYLESRIIDNFLIGISDSKVLFINTEKEEEINNYIIHEIKSGTSEIKIKSGYKGIHKNLLMCVVPTEKYMLLKEEIKKIDKDAFITVLDAYEVYGGTNRYKLPLHDLRI